MKPLLVLAFLGAFAAAVESAPTVPGTIVSTSASVSYSDDAGQPMPQETSNTADVLVVPANPGRVCLMPVRALHKGPSTVGRLVRIVGTVVEDSTGTWIDDGSVIRERDASGKWVSRRLRARLNALFLSAKPVLGQRMIIVGISQVAPDGSPVVVPISDANLAILTR